MEGGNAGTEVNEDSSVAISLEFQEHSSDTNR